MPISVSGEQHASRPFNTSIISLLLSLAFLEILCSQAYRLTRTADCVLLVSLVIPYAVRM